MIIYIYIGTKRTTMHYNDRGTAKFHLFFSLLTYEVATSSYIFLFFFHVCDKHKVCEWFQWSRHYRISCNFKIPIVWCSNHYFLFHEHKALINAFSDHEITEFHYILRFLDYKIAAYKLCFVFISIIRSYMRYSDRGIAEFHEFFRSLY